MWEKYEFTILMPCLDEERTVGECVLEAKKYVQEKGLQAEILVVDNGSTDHSYEIAKRCGARVISVAEKGYGNALIGGIYAARGKYVIMGDCDQSYDFYHLDNFVEKLREGYQFVNGNRFLGGIEKGAMPVSHRYFGVPLLSLIGRIRYGTFIGDFHCGIRGFERVCAIDMEFRCTGMEFSTEMIGKFAMSGSSMTEVPVVLRKDKRGRKSHLRSFADGWRHLNYMLSPFSI